MFWMDFATCQQRLSARSTGNTLQNPLGKAEATKKWRADTLLVCVTGFPGPGYRKWLWDSRPWEGKHTAGGGGDLQILLVLSIGNYFNLHICSHLHVHDLCWGDPIRVKGSFPGVFCSRVQPSYVFLKERRAMQESQAWGFGHQRSWSWIPAPAIISCGRLGKSFNPF